MKKYCLFISFLFLFFTGISQIPYKMDKQIIPGHLLNSKNSVFALENGEMVFINSPDGQNSYLFRYNLESDLLDSFNFDFKINTPNNPIVDLYIINKSEFLILDFTRVIRIGLKDKKISKIEEIKIDAKKRFVQIHVNPTSNSIYVSTNFTSNAQKEPKIIIEKLNSNWKYEHYAKCDPFNIHPYYRLVANNEKANFAVIEDGLEGVITILDSNLNQLNKIRVLRYKMTSQEIDAICELNKKNIVINSNATYDMLSRALDKIPTIERITFWNDSTILLYGEDRIKDSIFPVVLRIIFDSNWNLIRSHYIDYSIWGNKGIEKFDAEKIPFNPYGYSVKSSNGFVYLLSDYVDLKIPKNFNDFIKLRYMTNHQPLYCIYRYRLIKQ